MLNKLFKPSFISTGTSSVNNRTYLILIYLSIFVCYVFIVQGPKVNKSKSCSLFKLSSIARV